MTVWWMRSTELLRKKQLMAMSLAPKPPMSNVANVPSKCQRTTTSQSAMWIGASTRTTFCWGQTRFGKNQRCTIYSMRITRKMLSLTKRTTGTWSLISAWCPCLPMSPNTTKSGKRSRATPRVTASSGNSATAPKSKLPPICLNSCLTRRAIRGTCAS